MTGPPPDSWAVDPEEAAAIEVMPGLWRLRLPVGWEHMDHVNAYLLEGEDGPILIDSGSAGDPSCTVALELAINRAGHRVEDVSALALTHVHSDHAGQAAWVVERSGAPVLSHPADEHFYGTTRDPEASFARREDRARREGVPEDRLFPYADTREEVEGVIAAVAPDVELTDGAGFDSALGRWEAFDTPGHAPSHVALIQRERRIAIVGDTICTVFVPWLDYGRTADPAGEVLGSYDALEDAGPLELALPGHGRPLTDAATIVAAHRDAVHERIAAVRDSLGGEPQTGHELAERVFGTAPDLAAIGFLSETLGHLRYLRLRGEAVRTTAADGTHRYTRAPAARRGGPPQ
jgi:glyoxylase-like metal-dependent hydrolase (beta-lactamase superfamily II)